MPIKKVFQSETPVYPPATIPVPRDAEHSGGGFGFHYFYADPVNRLRIYDDYYWAFRGLFTMKSPTYPGEYEIHLVSVMSQDPWPSWAVITSVWDGKTGAFLGRRATITSFQISKVWAAPDGSIWSNSLYTTHLLRYDPVTWLATEHPVATYGSNIGAVGYGWNVFATDPVKDLLIMVLSSNDNSQLSVCRLSTGDWLRNVNVAGRVEWAFLANAGTAYAVSDNGILTAFNYETGEVQGVLDTGFVSGGFDWGVTAFTWDPFMRRVLYCHNPGDTLPDGDCNVNVKGYYPVALPVGMTPPIPLKHPRKGRTVPVFNRVYGAASEGIVGQELTYTVGNDSAATVSPGRKASENNGTVQVQLAGVLAGANSIVSETSVP
jgi:hypothetical protein